MNGKAWEAKIVEENQALHDAGRALVVRMPTPYNEVERLGDGKFVIYKRPSTVDFVGCTSVELYPGTGVAYEAKHTTKKLIDVYLPKSATRRRSGLQFHQRNFLAHWTNGGGISFVYVGRSNGERWLLPVSWQGVVANVVQRDRKSFAFTEDNERFRLLPDEDWLSAYERITT